MGARHRLLVPPWFCTHLPFCYLHIYHTHRSPDSRFQISDSPVSDCSTPLQHPNITWSSQPWGPLPHSKHHRPQNHRTAPKRRDFGIEAESRPFLHPTLNITPSRQRVFIIPASPTAPAALASLAAVSALHARMVQTSFAVRLPEDIDAIVKETRYGSG